MKRCANEITVVIAATTTSEPEIRRYADMITGSPPTRIHLAETARAVDGAPSIDLTAEIQYLAVTKNAELIVCEWFQNPAIMQRLLQLAHELKIPTVFIRPGRAVTGGRLVVATGGGRNVCEQIWIAGEVAAGTDRSLEVFHWQPAASPRRSENLAVEQMVMHLLGTEAAVYRSTDSDFVSGIVGYLRANDLLVMGAPSSLRWAADFAGSLPDRVASQIDNPLFLLYSPSAGRVNLRHLFWGGLIKPQMQSSSREEALNRLIYNLIDHNQLPPGSKDEILHRALYREAIQATAVDCETAFPHVTLPGFFGVAGSLGIFPDGVDFGGKDGSLSHFIFLMVTPEGFSDEYLTALAKIARRMVNEDVRRALLECKTSAEALNLLEPNKKAGCTIGADVKKRITK